MPFYYRPDQEKVLSQKFFQDGFYTGEFNVAVKLLMESIFKELDKEIALKG